MVSSSGANDTARASPGMQRENVFPPSMAQRKAMGYPQREAATALAVSPTVASIFGWHLWISVKIAESSSIPLSPSIRSSTNRGAISRICRAILLGRPTRPPKSTSQRTCVGKKNSKNPPRSEIALLYPEPVTVRGIAGTFRVGASSGGRRTFSLRCFPKRPLRSFRPVENHPALFLEATEKFPHVPLRLFGIGFEKGGDIPRDLFRRVDPVDPGPDLGAHEVQLVDGTLNHERQYAQVLVLLSFSRPLPGQLPHPLFLPPDDFGVALRTHVSSHLRHADPARVGHPAPRLARHPDVSHLAAPQAEDGLRRNNVRGHDV